MWQPGDVWILNDSYLAGTHLNDLTVFAPIFHAGELVGFAASRAHWIDVGAKDPGGPMDATEIYQEGIRLAAATLVAGGGKRRDVVDILGRNSRFPHPAIGDLHAQIACCTPASGASRRSSTASARHRRAAREEIFAQSERLDRAAIAAIPDGVYAPRASSTTTASRRRAVLGPRRDRGRGRRDDDRPHGVDDMQARADQLRRGAGDLGVPRRVQAHVQPGPRRTAARSGRSRSRPPRARSSAREEPAPCQWYFTPLGLLIDLVVKALAAVVPERAAAASYGDSMIISLTGSTRERAGGSSTWSRPSAAGARGTAPTARTG